MAIFTSPTSYRIANGLGGAPRLEARQLLINMGDLTASSSPHSSHPSFLHLVLLVFEAVLEVVCVSLPGYIAARQGMFDADAQKLVANLNVALFTPCLVFTKLASQLTAQKLTDLAIIPFIFIVQTFVSYMCSWFVSRCFRFKKRQSNFVAAMAVFGNSNSLPISLVISLSQTLKGLHWDRVPNDNDDEVAARGILYLLIFQQLGQLVRWSWGYHVLLAPKERYIEDDPTGARIEDGQAHYTDNPEQTDPDEPLIRTRTSDDITVAPENSVEGTATPHNQDGAFESGGQTPVTARTYSYTKLSSMGDETMEGEGDGLLAPPPRGPFLPRQNSAGLMTSFPRVEIHRRDEQAKGFKGLLQRYKRSVCQFRSRLARSFQEKADAAFERLPPSIQKGLSTASSWTKAFFKGVWDFMNPPLWAMLVAIIVASLPDLQRLFFDEGSFIKNSVTRAINQNGQVAVPLILVVLGANLARNTLPKEAIEDMEDPKEERKLIIASLVSRMLLPTLIMAPILALVAKYVPVSILGDPIFIIVCFLLTGAPSALQLAQICQINNVYMGAMSQLLFQSYVVWILPSTLFLVVCALEVVEWAAQGK
ncbi:hypothetical protein VTN00DRAFT_9440 [Thermoascus crustaceus]|uniref:uncharacterized protein n=1 Tax=Thermoascus crustaceus TaxID=5088 RepID=UPI0037427583